MVNGIDIPPFGGWGPDKIDLYSDRGVLLKSDVELSAVSPLKNAAMQRLISLTTHVLQISS